MKPRRVSQTSRKGSCSVRPSPSACDEKGPGASYKPPVFDYLWGADSYRVLDLKKNRPPTTTKPKAPMMSTMLTHTGNPPPSSSVTPGPTVGVAVGAVVATGAGAVVGVTVGAVVAVGDGDRRCRGPSEPSSPLALGPTWPWPSELSSP